MNMSALVWGRKNTHMSASHRNPNIHVYIRFDAYEATHKVHSGVTLFCSSSEYSSKLGETLRHSIF